MYNKLLVLLVHLEQAVLLVHLVHLVRAEHLVVVELLEQAVQAVQAAKPGQVFAMPYQEESKPKTLFGKLFNYT